MTLFPFNSSIPVGAWWCKRSPTSGQCHGLRLSVASTTRRVSVFWSPGGGTRICGEGGGGERWRQRGNCSSGCCMRWRDMLLFRRGILLSLTHSQAQTHTKTYSRLHPLTLFQSSTLSLYIFFPIFLLPFLSSLISPSLREPPYKVASAAKTDIYAYFWRASTQGTADQAASSNRISLADGVMHVRSSVNACS